MHLGLIGCGRWGQYILRDLRALGCEVSVVTVTDGTGKQAMEQGATAAYTALDDLPAVDGVLIATPTIHHADIIRAVLPRKVPVFVEKPLCINAGEAFELAGQARDILFVMDKWRYHAGVKLLAQIAGSQEFGKVTGLNTKRVQSFNPHSDVDSIWILAPHDISIALSILGYVPTPRAAYAEYTGQKLSGLFGVLADEGLHFILEVSESYHAHSREIRMQCEQALLVLSNRDDTVIEILNAQGGRTSRPIPNAGSMPLYLELEAFVHHVAGGPPPMSSAQEGAQTVAVIGQLRRLAGLEV